MFPRICQNGGRRPGQVPRQDGGDIQRQNLVHNRRHRVCRESPGGEIIEVLQWRQEDPAADSDQEGQEAPGKGKGDDEFAREYIYFTKQKAVLP